MEERKTIFDYIGMVFSVFGFSIAVLTIFCVLFGEEAGEVSNMFSMGGEGLSVATMTQYFAVSACIIFFRFLFCTDTIIKNMAIAARTVCMVASAVGTIIVFVLCFGWFPADMWLPWILFIVCFLVCFAVSMAVAVQREKVENRKMEEALARLKQQEEEYEVRN